MPSQAQNLHYFWLHECRQHDDGGFVVKTTGWKGEDHYEDEERIEDGDENVEVWKWIHESRESFPSILPAELFPNLVKTYRGNTPEIHVPADGYYFMEAKWSDHAEMARHELVATHAEKPLPRPLSLVDSKSRDAKLLFPHLACLCDGWGELIGFKDGKCDLFMQLGEDLSMLEQILDYLYRHNLDEPAGEEGEEDNFDDIEFEHEEGSN